MITTINEWKKSKINEAYVFDFEDWDDTDLAGMRAEMDIDELIAEYSEIINREIDKEAAGTGVDIKNAKRQARKAVGNLWKEKIDEFIKKDKLYENVKINESSFVENPKYDEICGDFEELRSELMNMLDISQFKAAPLAANKIAKKYGVTAKEILADYQYNEDGSMMEENKLNESGVIYIGNAIYEDLIKFLNNIVIPKSKGYVKNERDAAALLLDIIKHRYNF